MPPFPQNRFTALVPVFAAFIALQAIVCTAVNAQVNPEGEQRIAILLVWDNVHRDGSITEEDQLGAVNAIADFLYQQTAIDSELEVFEANVGRTPHGTMKTVASLRLDNSQSSATTPPTTTTATSRSLLSVSNEGRENQEVRPITLLQKTETEEMLKAHIGERILGHSTKTRSIGRGLKGFEGRVTPPRLVRILTTEDTAFGATDRADRKRVTSTGKNGNRFTVMGTEKNAGLLGNNKRFTPRYFTKGPQANQKIASTSNSLWDLDRINQLSAILDDNIALPNVYAQTPPEPPHVYLVDTHPLVSHQEFENRLSIIHNGHADTDGDQACDPHGTFVASKIMGKTVGVNPNALLFSASALNCEGWGYTSDIYLSLAAIHEHCTAQGGRAQRSISINLSLGGPGDPNSPSSAAMALLFKELYIDCDANIIVAAGNSAVDARTFIPAGFSGPDQGNVQTIGATNIVDEFAAFSNYGPKVDMNAPGVNILGAGISSDSTYETMSGTSASAPIITGIMSLYHTTRPSNFDLLYPGHQFADNAINKYKADGNRIVRKVPTTTTTVRLAYVSPDPIPSNELLAPVAPAFTPPAWVQSSNSAPLINTTSSLLVLSLACVLVMLNWLLFL